MCRNTCETFVFVRKHESDVDARVVQVPCGNQPAAAVSTSASTHGHALGVEPLASELCQIASCVLHHLDELDAEILHHDSINFDHLIGRKPCSFHGTTLVSYRA